MSLCQHPREMVQMNGAGGIYCSACADVNEGGRWRPSRDSTPTATCEQDCPYRNEEGLPYDLNVVMSSFKVAVLASIHERGEPDPTADKMMVMLDLAADSARRFSNLMRTLAANADLPKSPR